MTGSTRKRNILKSPRDEEKPLLRSPPQLQKWHAGSWRSAWICLTSGTWYPAWFSHEPKEGKCRRVSKATCSQYKDVGNHMSMLKNFAKRLQMLDDDRLDELVSTVFFFHVADQKTASWNGTWITLQRNVLATRELTSVHQVSHSIFSCWADEWPWLKDLEALKEEKEQKYFTHFVLQICVCTVISQQACECYLDRTTTIAYKSIAQSATLCNTNCSSVKKQE